METTGIEVLCPSGLRGLVRPLVVGDISSLSAPSNRKAPDPLGLLFRNVWLRTLDVGPYGPADGVEEGKGIDRWERLLVGDRAFLVFESRRVTYGDEFFFTVPCRSCRTKIEWKLDLSELEASGLSEEASEGVATAGVKDACFYRTLPQGGQRVGLRLLTGEHQRKVEVAKQGGDQLMSEAALLCRLADIEGATSPGDRKTFIREMSLLDLDYLREQWEELDIFVTDTIEIECMSCGGEQEIMIPTDERFFSPRSAKPKKRLKR
jgi:hypothetical protein